MNLTLGLMVKFKLDNVCKVFSIVWGNQGKVKKKKIAVVIITQHFIAYLTPPLALRLSRAIISSHWPLNHWHLSQCLILSRS